MAFDTGRERSTTAAQQCDRLTANASCLILLTAAFRSQESEFRSENGYSYSSQAEVCTSFNCNPLYALSQGRNFDQYEWLVIGFTTNGITECYGLVYPFQYRYGVFYMAQIFDPLPSESTNPILCCYVNATSRVQIARISNIPNWYFERVVFPGQRLVFEALPEAHLEIHSGMMASAILSDTIPCDRLCIQEEISPTFDHAEQQQRERLNEGVTDNGIATEPATAAP